MQILYERGRKDMLNVRENDEEKRHVFDDCDKIM